MLVLGGGFTQRRYDAKGSRLVHIAAAEGRLWFPPSFPLRLGVSLSLAIRKQNVPRTSQRLLDFYQGGKGRKIFPRLKALHIARTHPHRLRKRLLGHPAASAQPCDIASKNKTMPARARFDGWHDAMFANEKNPNTRLDLVFWNCYPSVPYHRTKTPCPSKS